MQIVNSVVCDTSKGSLYKKIKPPLVGEHAFPMTRFDCETVHILSGKTSDFTAEFTMLNAEWHFLVKIKY